MDCCGRVSVTNDDDGESSSTNPSANSKVEHLLNHDKTPAGVVDGNGKNVFIVGPATDDGPLCCPSRQPPDTSGGFEGGDLSTDNFVLRGSATK